MTQIDRNVFKISNKIYGDSTDAETQEATLKSFLENNYAVYGWNMTERFLQMKTGDLIVLHSGEELKYIGEITLPPHNWKFYNASNIPYLDKIDDRFNEDRNEWYMVCVKKWINIEYLDKKTNRGSAIIINKEENKKPLIEIYDWLSKI